MQRRLMPSLSVFSLLLFIGCGGGETFQDPKHADGSFQPETEGGVSAEDGAASGQGGQAASGQGGQAGGSGDGPAVGDAGPAHDAGQGDRDAVGPVECERRVFVDDVTNARDLGGHPLSNGSSVACGVIFHGGDLSALSETGCAEFEQLGIETVVDLREDVDRNVPNPSCVMDNAEVLDATMPKLLPDTPENYLALLGETEVLGRIFEALGRAESFPVYIHCVIGRDRASFVTALILLALGADRQTVIDEFMLSEQAGVAVKQECIEAVLDEIDQRGGIEAYLSSAGVTAEQLEALRARAIAE